MFFYVQMSLIKIGIIYTHSFRMVKININEEYKMKLSKLVLLLTLGLFFSIVNATETLPEKSEATKNEIKRFVHVSMMHTLKNVEGILHSLAALKKRTADWEMLFVGPKLKNNVELVAKLKS